MQELYSTVYMTKDISSKGLLELYRKMHFPKSSRTAIKLSTGETGSNYLRPEFIEKLVKETHGTIVECNTAYGGERSETDLHEKLIQDHGFDNIADVVILDAYEDLTIPVADGYHLEESYIGAGIEDFNSIIVLSHFKGHTMAGFGGALKNLSIGFASSTGKSWIHTAGRFTEGIEGDTNEFLESMCDACQAIISYFDKSNKNVLYINVMNNLSVDCDCDTNPAEPTMKDIGILASYDPVALDAACIDLVYASKDGQDLIDRIESKNGIHLIDCCDESDIGTSLYTLIEI